MENNIAYERLTELFDDGLFNELDRYSSGDAAIAYGTVSGIPCYAFSQYGPIGTAHCEKIKKAYDLASKTGCPIIGIYDSNGVKLDEGFNALNAYGDLLKASTSVSGVIPQISVIAGSCLGVSALMANMADIVIALNDSDFYITAPSDITAEKSCAEGCVDILSESFEEAAESVKKLVSLIPENNLSPAPILEFDEPSGGDDALSIIADNNSLIELKAHYADFVITALGTVSGRTTGFVFFNGESVAPRGVYKAESFVKLCDAFSIPIVTIADNNGFEKNNEAQMLVSATKLVSAYATATCPKVSLITKQSFGGAYVALAGKGANADITFAWDNAVAAPLDIDAAVAFIYSERLAKGESREALAEEYKSTSASAKTAAESGAVDDVFAPSETRAKIISALDMLSGKRENTIPRKHSVK